MKCKKIFECDERKILCNAQASERATEQFQFLLFFFVEGKEGKKEKFYSNFYPRTHNYIHKKLKLQSGWHDDGVGWLDGWLLSNECGSRMRTNDRKCFKQGGKWKGGCLRQGETESMRLMENVIQKM